jgi:hypothetical protein
MNTNLVQTTEETYFKIEDSDTLSRFGNTFLSKPARKSKLNERIFIDMRPEEVEQRRNEIGSVKTQWNQRCLPDCD